MPAPLNFDKLLIGDTCQITPEIWNALVKYVRCSIVAGATINSREFELTNTCMGQILNVDIPVGGDSPELCKSLMVSLKTEQAGNPVACINFGLIQIPPQQQARDRSLGLPGTLWPRTGPGTTPVYEQNLIELTVEGYTYDPDDPESWCIPYDPDTDIILLRLEARGGDEGEDPANAPEDIIPPSEVVSLDLRRYPRTPTADYRDILGKPAEYEFDGTNNIIVEDEVNMVFHWPLYDPRHKGGNVMGCNMQLVFCGENSWALSGLPSGYGIAPEAVYLPPEDETPTPTTTAPPTTAPLRHFDSP